MTWSFQAPTNEVSRDSELFNETSMTYRHYQLMEHSMLICILLTCQHVAAPSLAFLTGCLITIIIVTV